MKLTPLATGGAFLIFLGMLMPTIIVRSTSAYAKWHLKRTGSGRLEDKDIPETTPEPAVDESDASNVDPTGKDVVDSEALAEQSSEETGPTEVTASSRASKRDNRVLTTLCVLTVAATGLTAGLLVRSFERSDPR